MFLHRQMLLLIFRKTKTWQEVQNYTENTRYLLNTTQAVNRAFDIVGLSE